ncbi:lysozyme [Limibacter armeniacum]|uniref:lysozyme n=1 Tax=Limibacter armeniacum TaxID=466084 RepID=UPI002FE61519
MANKRRLLVIHCSDTPMGREVTKEDIIEWHIKGNGWSKPGYSDLIKLDGSIDNLQPFDQDDKWEPWEMTNGAKGFNGVAQHVCYAGGADRNMKPRDTRTEAQKKTLAAYVRIAIARQPDIQIAGHNQLSTKACPSFDVPQWLRSIGIEEKNIYSDKS